MRWWLVLCASLGCGGGSGGHGGGDANNGGGQTKLKTALDLTGVIGFAVAAPTSPRLEAPALDAGTCGASTLYALQANGDMVVTTVSETPAMGDAGTTCSSSMMREEADKVFDTPGYDIISYTTSITDCEAGQGSGGAPCNSCGFVVLRKSDGALFCGSSSRVMRVGGSHDKLYLGYPLTRLDMTANPPTSTLVDDDHITMDSFQTFDVDASDNALGAGNFGVRMFLASGGLINVDAMQEAFQWLDPAGTPYYAGGASGRFQAYRLAASTYTPTVVGSFAQATTAGFAMATATQAYEWTSFGGDSEIVDLMPSAAGGVCTNISGPATACANDTPCAGTCVGSGAKNCSGGPNNGFACLTDTDCNFQCSIGGARHVITGLPMVRQAVGTGDQMYVLGADNAGNGTILGIQPSAIAETACQLTSPTCPNTGGTCCSSAISPAVLIAPGDYSLSAISLSRSGELTFAGLRNADGAHVIGNCTASGCSVLNATAPVVTTLQRIN